MVHTILKATDFKAQTTQIT